MHESLILTSARKAILARLATLGCHFCQDDINEMVSMTVERYFTREPNISSLFFQKACKNMPRFKYISTLTRKIFCVTMTRLARKLIYPLPA